MQIRVAAAHQGCLRSIRQRHRDAELGNPDAVGALMFECLTAALGCLAKGGTRKMGGGPFKASP